MKFIADFHIHSHYSRATSKDCCPEMLDYCARQKGINIQGTGDFTHPAWRKELTEKLVTGGDGLYKIKNEFKDKSIFPEHDVRFIISGEISCIYKKNNKTRKVHNLILLPDLHAADCLSKRLEAVGNLHSDGRPILGLDSKDLLGMTLDACPQAIFIPAHIWTPHFSVLGSNSGFDAIEDCFEDLTGSIYALETGLSSDPPMNWRLSAIDKFALVSNSDAHSPSNLAREANVFDTELSYGSIYSSLKTNDRKTFPGTIEFFPEEGKYHFDGHRECGIQWEPARTIGASGKCPVCGGKLTIGVLHRVEELADRKEGFVLPSARSFERIVPLAQVIGSSIGSPSNSTRVQIVLKRMVEALGPELSILRETSIADIKAATGALLAEGIQRVREGRLNISPGFDGEYGKVEIFSEHERSDFYGQSNLFLDDLPKKKKRIATNSGRPIKKKEKNQKGSGNSQEIAFPYGLNKEQWNAVSANDRHVMVIAGPGAGKTRTLASRIAYLVNERGVEPQAIVAVTFTNRAAMEMSQRVAALLSDSQPSTKPTIGTFHGICLGLVKRADESRSTTIIDRSGSKALMDEALSIQGINCQASEAMKRISFAKANGWEGIRNLDQGTKAVYEEYQRRLERFNSMDFDDILLSATDILRQDDSLPCGVHSQWKHFLVDEYQDINETQYQLLLLLAKEQGSVFIIGDPHQAIYGFRGASPRYFETIKSVFPDFKCISLCRNYRSTSTIAGASYSVISCGKSNFLQPAIVETKHEHDDPIRLIEAKDEFTEALFIAKEINRCVGGIDMVDAQIFAPGKSKLKCFNRSFSDIAIIYRTHRQSKIIEQCLLKEDIQFRVVGRDEILDDEFARSAVSFFGFLLNPKSVCLLIECLKQFDKKSAYPIAEQYAMKGSYRFSDLDDIVQKENKKLIDFINLINRFLPRIEKENPSILIRDWLTEQGRDEKEQCFKLIYFAENYTDMQSFLWTLTMGREADIMRFGTQGKPRDAVTLMTLHAAKGLEFPVVFLCGVNEGLIPLINSKEDPVDLDEERRLFYVGLTRAKEELICTMARKKMINGSIQLAEPSSFIKDIGKQFLTREKFHPELEAKQMSFL